MLSSGGDCHFNEMAVPFSRVASRFVGGSDGARKSISFIFIIKCLHLVASYYKHRNY